MSKVSALINSGKFNLLQRRPRVRSGVYVASASFVAFQAFGFNGPQPNLPRANTGPSPSLGEQWRARRHRRVADFLMLLNIVIFALDFLTGNKLTVLGVKHNPSIVAGQYWRLLSCTFLHGGILHLAMNMWALNSMASMERNLGRGMFAFFYLASGVVGAAASFLFSPALSLGASGSVFGLFSASWMFLENNKRLLSKGSRRMQESLFRTMLVNLALGVFITKVDNWGHAGGFMAGLLLAYLFGPRYKSSVKGRNLENRPRIALPWSLP